MTDPKLEQAQAQAQGGGEVPWRAHGAAMDAKALATAQEIALMWGHDRSQFVSRIQVAVLDAMRWIAAAAPPSAPVGVEGLMQLARNWCLAWGEWAYDADPGCAKENAAEAALRAALTTALAQQPAACPKCGGAGEADSGGIMPWGAPAMILCECQQPAAVADDARMARALEWARALTKPCSAEEREMLANVEEAIAAYDPNCGARTVRLDDALVKRVWELYWRAEKSGDVIVTEKEMHAIASLITRARTVRVEVDLSQFREAVECWLDAALPANDVEAERKAKAQRLLSIIDNAGKVEAEPSALTGEPIMKK